MFLTWIPQYFLHNYQMNLKNSAVFASGVFFAGVAGDWLGGHITDWLLARTGSLTKARSYMVVVCNLLTLGSLLPILFVHDSTVAAICLSLGFFFAEMTIGPMWADSDGYCAEIFRHGQRPDEHRVPRWRPSSAWWSGGWIIDATGNWDWPFIGSMVLLLVGAGLAFTMKPEEKF